VASRSERKLFDEFERTDSTRKPYSGESVFQFMNRVDRADWARVREELEGWYSEYPDSDNDLRNRFQSQREDQDYGAWWELYIHTFYRRLGYAVDVHPMMPNGTKPDLLVTRGGVSTYVECKAGDPWQDLINAGEVVKAARRVTSTTSNLDRGRGQLKSQLCSRPCRMRGRWHGSRSAWCGSLVGLVGPVRGSLLPPRGRYLGYRQRTCSHAKRPKRS